MCVCEREREKQRESKVLLFLWYTLRNHRVANGQAKIWPTSGKKKLIVSIGIIIKPRKGNYKGESIKEEEGDGDWERERDHLNNLSLNFHFCIYRNWDMHYFFMFLLNIYFVFCWIPLLTLHIFIIRLALELAYVMNQIIKAKFIMLFRI